MTHPNEAERSSIYSAGEAMKATGEDGILIGWWPSTGTFSCRLELPGTSGVFGSGRTADEAYDDARTKRIDRQSEMNHEAEVRAEIGRRRERLAA